MMRLFSVVALCLVIAGCADESPSEPYAARVGDTYLTEAELSDAMKSIAVGGDTVEARRQIVDQWVTRTLLLNEAERLNLESESDVQRQLREQRRSVLINALTSRIYETAEVEPSREAVTQYFERNRDRLRLREPYLQLRHVRVADASTASTLASELRSAPQSWTTVCQRDASDPEQACAVGTRFYPERQRTADAPALRDRISNMNAGEVTTIEGEDWHHVLHLVERIEAGQEPELEWVAPQIERHLSTQSRKQMYAREVQRLRNEAEARGALDVHLSAPAGNDTTTAE
ncbi:hypothetical protein CRI93_01540 [Longimonas halophila]|uniref:PpiC domain-containing protein n=1 Tax=Longimonas halophila TaxID=1469170 RepID=A0A2H3NT87_9BACT|nr:peptidylprolyl isomerase [Longimonas halophila]PEN09436.1 hypothetical protein CRI93_01540 [Longimonas halophila]